MTEFAQVVVTDDQAALVAQAIALALENSTEDQVGDAEENLKTLAVFFATVASEPKRFPITGRMASKLADIRRDAKGPAKPVTRRNRRKVRQLARQGGAKRRRVEHKDNVANFNAAREAYLVDIHEMQRNREEDETRARALMAQEVLTPEEHLELLTIFGAPPAILEAAGKIRAVPETPTILLP